MPNIIVNTKRLESRSVAIPGADLTAGVSLSQFRSLFKIIAVDDSSTYQWSVRIEGGLTLIGPLSSYSFIPGSQVGCTPTSGPADDQITITTPAGDSGGRTYVLTMRPEKSTPFIIQRTLGAVPATTLTVTFETLIDIF